MGVDTGLQNLKGVTYFQEAIHICFCGQLAFHKNFMTTIFPFYTRYINVGYKVTASVL